MVFVCVSEMTSMILKLMDDLKHTHTHPSLEDERAITGPLHPHHKEIVPKPSNVGLE